MDGITWPLGCGAAFRRAPLQQVDATANTRSHLDASSAFLGFFKFQMDDFRINNMADMFF